MSGLIDAEEFRKQFFELETEFRPSQIDAVFDCLYNSEILDVDKKERNMSEVRLIDVNAAISVFADMGQDIDTHDAIDLLKEQPTVDAVPVEWIKEKIESLKAQGNEFASLSARIIQAMLNDYGADGERR